MDSNRDDRFDEVVAGALDRAGALGVAAEAYVGSARSTKVGVQDGVVETFNLTEARGLGIRVFRDSQVGYAYTESFEPAAVSRAVDSAVQNAALLPADEFAGLEAFAEPAPELGLYNPDLAQVPVERKVAFALELDRVAHEADPRVKTVTGSSYGDTTGFVRIASTRGVDRWYRASMAWGVVRPLLAQDDQNKTYGLYRAARCFDELNPEWLAQEAVRRSAEKLGAREMPGGKLPVVFAPDAFADLLATFSAIFSAKVAQEGKSLLAGRVGEGLASPAFTLLDDPLQAGGFGSRPFDDEGCVSRPFALFEKGVFKGFLHNSETARKEGTITTGHAARGGYAGTLRVGTSNLVVQAGTRRREALLTSAPRVLEVTEVTGLHAGASSISGDFSLPAQGFLYEGGVRTPVHQFTVSGNFVQLLAAVAEAANDVEVLPSGISTPSILVAELAIAGK